MTNNFQCKRCGRCCGVVPFTKAEYKTIRSIAKKMHIGFIKNDLEGRTVYLPKKTAKALCQKIEVIQNGGEMNFDDLSCPFLTFDEFGKSSCTIYEKRPRVCRLFGEIEHPCMKCPNNTQTGGLK